MAESSVAKGYAEALLALAKARGEVEEVERQVRLMAQLLKHRTALRHALDDPSVPDEERIIRLEKALEGVAGQLLREHVLGMVRQGHGTQVTQMAHLFLESLSGEAALAAEVWAAVPLDQNQVERIERALGRKYGKPVRVHPFVDPSLIGGLAIRVGNELLDATVKGRLEAIRAAMRQETPRA